MRRTLTALSLLALISVTAHAAVITKVSGEQVLIDLQGDSSYTEGSRYLLMVGDKKKAVVEISKVKGDRAIGKVLKGTAQVSGTLAALPTSGGASSAASSAPARSSRSARSSSRRSRRERSGSITYGGVIGYGSTSQTVAVTKGGVSETIAMTGSSISLKGFADLPISGNFGVLGRVGIENFGVAGSSPNLGAVETKIMYLSADVLMRYLFLEGKFRPFPLLGMGLHYPLSKSSGVLDVQRISATTIFFLGGGFNYTLNETMYLHATLEYGLFPPSNDVKTSLIAGRIGVGFNL
jgi:hypothetical protein